MADESDKGILINEKSMEVLIAKFIPTSQYFERSFDLLQTQIKDLVVVFCNAFFCHFNGGPFGETCRSLLTGGRIYFCPIPQKIFLSDTKASINEGCLNINAFQDKCISI